MQKENEGFSKILYLDKKYQFLFINLSFTSKDDRLQCCVIITAYHRKNGNRKVATGDCCHQDCCHLGLLPPRTFAT